MGKSTTPSFYMQWSYLKEGYPSLLDHNWSIWDVRSRFGKKPHGVTTSENIRTVMLKMCQVNQMLMPKRARIVSQRKKDKGTVIAEYTFAMFEALE